MILEPKILGFLKANSTPITSAYGHYKFEYKGGTINFWERGDFIQVEMDKITLLITHNGNIIWGEDGDKNLTTHEYISLIKIKRILKEIYG
jgi:hypothetical protein